MRSRDPYQWYSAFELLDQFEGWARDLEERHRIEMNAVSRAAGEATADARDWYRKLAEPFIQATATEHMLGNPPLFAIKR